MTSTIRRMTQLFLLICAAMVVLMGCAGSQQTQPTAETLAQDLQVAVDSAQARGIRLAIGVQVLGDPATTPAPPLLLGSADSFHPASTIKLLLIAALMQQVDAGHLNLSDSITVYPSDIVGGMGILQTQPAPQRVSLARLAELTVTESDNTATNVLVDVVGYDAMERLAGQLGLGTTRFGRKMFEAAQPPLRDNFITVADAMTLLREMYQGQWLSEPSRRQILTWMGAQTVDTKIGAGVPARADAAHKTGENGPVSHDMGYLQLRDGTVALALFAEAESATDFDAAQALLNPILADIAGQIYRVYR